MTAALPFAVAGLALAVLAVLALGVINMARKDHDPRTSNRLMQWRVGLQLAAVLLLVLMLIIGRG